jgi:fimbrial chaperone protein
MTARRSFSGLAAGAIALAAAFSAQAGNFGVSPIRVELDRATKSALVTVSNDDTKPLAFQVRALEWSQEPNGADRYTETADLVYFPQQFKVAPSENRVVRVGYKVPATQSEKTYRLFIEELADPQRDASSTGIAVTLRFGVPIFLRPAAASVTGELDLAIKGGVAQVLVKNTGNAHFRLASVNLTVLGAGGETVHQQSVDGWYVLTGVQRPYTLSLPPEACARAKLLRVEAPAEKLVLRAERELAPADCR